MDFRQLNAFIAVFEERNITSAARRLFLTQPGLSATIKMLEEELGTQLFERLPRGVEVTGDARILYPHARRMVAEIDALTRSFKKERDRQPILIGVEQDIAAHQIAHFVKRAQDREFNLLLTLESGCVGDVRFGCEELRCEDELFLPLFDEQFVLAIPSTHALAGRVSLIAEDLHDLCWIMCPQHASHQRLLPIYGATAHSPAANASTFSLALNLAVAGIGITIVPESLAREHVGLIIKPLPGHSLTRRVGVCYAVQAMTMPSVAQLLQNISRENG
jgi:LysR family transcriptional regulator, benzoate and cis,cis-muconate-responsive activator of ben and cat genes